MKENKMYYQQYLIESQQGITLSLRYYASNKKAKRIDTVPIVLVHGLMNSADVFDVPGCEENSPALRLANLGYDVYTYDQRGVGQSSIVDWNFGLAENALVDLPHVARAALENSHASQVILGGYSLGGLIIYLLVTHLFKYDTDLFGLNRRHIRKIFTIASPGTFQPRTGKWKYLFSRGGKYLAGANPCIDRIDFLKSQIYIRSPLMSLLLPKYLIRAALKSAQMSLPTAYVIKNLPIPSFLYRPSDFTARTFYHIARCRVLDRTSRKLFSELFHFADLGGKITIKSQIGKIQLPDDFRFWHDLPVLIFSSRKDELVMSKEVEAVAKSINGTIHRIIDDTCLDGCGHSGFVFNNKVFDYVFSEIEGFI